MHESLIFEQQNEFWIAEIRTIDHPTSKFQATFVTRKGIKPVTHMQCGWNTVEAAHKMITWQAEKFEKNGKNWNPVT
jgi:hypothetical protein